VSPTTTTTYTLKATNATGSVTATTTVTVSGCANSRSVCDRTNSGLFDPGRFCNILARIQVHGWSATHHGQFGRPVGRFRKHPNARRQVRQPGQIGRAWRIGDGNDFRSAGWSVLLRCLASPITLTANTTYYLLSFETEGADAYYDQGGTSVTTTTDATVNSAGVLTTDTNILYDYGSTGNTWGPVNFKYVGGAGGGGTGGGGTGTKPSISSFTASPTSITSGSTASLKWTVTGATTISISPTIGTVTGTSINVTPTTTTTYTLTATNGYGSSTATATVTVTSGGGTDQCFRRVRWSVRLMAERQNELRRCRQRHNR
jgi:hypothetical protein